MKKSLFRLAGLVVAAAIVVGASRLWAESKGKKPAPRTRIALLNLTYVIKNYEKYQHFQEEIKRTVEPFKKKDGKLRAQLEKLGVQARSAMNEHPGIVTLSPLPAVTATKSADKKKTKKDAEIVPAKAEKPVEPAKTAGLEEKIKKLQRALEDNSAEAKMVLSRKSEEEMKTLFMDIYQAAERYAASHDLDLVLHYNDAITKEDYFSAANIARKLQSGACMPLYTTESMDISKDIADVLNSGLKKQ